MRRLILLRHAKSDRAEQGKSDADRVLAERGRKDAMQLGAYMARHALMPDRALVSPARRTQETWRYLSGAWKPEPAASTVEKLYEATHHTLFAAIKNAPATAHTLMMVAHNPGLHDLALMLVASGDIDARESLHESLPTSGLVIIDFAFDGWDGLHPASGRLERFIHPKTIDAASGV